MTETETGFLIQSRGAAPLGSGRGSGFAPDAGLVLLQQHRGPDGPAWAPAIACDPPHPPAPCSSGTHQTGEGGSVRNRVTCGFYGLFSNEKRVESEFPDMETSKKPWNVVTGMAGIF